MELASRRTTSSYNAIVVDVTEAILIAAVVVGVLACPVMMLFGRRGIGPGCAMMNCETERRDDSLDALRKRQRELDSQVAELERTDRAGAGTG